MYKNNDAAILSHILKNNKEDVLKWVEDRDVFIVDRGFRNSLTLLEYPEFISAMPAAFMKKGEKQMSTADANTNRLVTKIRWVVDSANARIKRWKFIDRVFPSSQVPFISDYIKIVCEISNKYFPPLSTGCTEENSIVAAKMKYLSKQTNQLKEKLEEKKLDTRSASQGTP